MLHIACSASARVSASGSRSAFTSTATSAIVPISPRRLAAAWRDCASPWNSDRSASCLLDSCGCAVAPQSHAIDNNAASIARIFCVLSAGGDHPTLPCRLEPVKQRRDESSPYLRWARSILRAGPVRQHGGRRRVLERVGQPTPALEPAGLA